MKTLRIFSALLLVACVLMIPVSAALEFVPSIEQKNGLIVNPLSTDANGDKILGTVKTADGKTTYLTSKQVTLTNLSEADDADEEIENGLNQAYEQLKKSDIETVLPGFSAKWAEITGGAPVSNAVVAHLFDISSTTNIESGSTVTFELDGHGLVQGAYIVIIHNYDGDKWEIVPGTWTMDGNIRFTVSSLSPFALLVDSGKAPTTSSGAPSSPSTAETDLSVLTAVICLAAVAFSSVCAVKLSKKSAR